MLSFSNNFSYPRDMFCCLSCLLIEVSKRTGEKHLLQLSSLSARESMQMRGKETNDIVEDFLPAKETLILHILTSRLDRLEE